MVVGFMLHSEMNQKRQSKGMISHKQIYFQITQHASPEIPNNRSYQDTFLISFEFIMICLPMIYRISDIYEFYFS
uniref:Putative ovule protein n=1 Tax=Solanum chacoense TaxID=4108 RepID=A0A0V0H9U9_SOLCH